eukprot:EG_transcript_14385
MRLAAGVALLWLLLLPPTAAPAMDPDCVRGTNFSVVAEPAVAVNWLTAQPVCGDHALAAGCAHFLEWDWVRLVVLRRLNYTLHQSLQSYRMGRHTVFVVDHLAKAMAADAPEACRRCGARCGVLHLGNENKPAGDFYDRFAFVLRNYWPGRRMPEQYRGRYAFLPLGYGQGWGAFEGQPNPPMQNRTYNWCFLGDPHKSSRKEMLRALRAVPRGMWFTYRGFGSRSMRSAARMRATMANARLCPAPSGYRNVESFRVYEALEAGCIPIVNRWPVQRVDRVKGVWRLMLGPALANLIPEVEDWAQPSTLQLVRGLLADLAGLERRRRRLTALWRAFKAANVSEMARRTVLGEGRDPRQALEAGSSNCNFPPSSSCNLSVAVSEPRPTKGDQALDSVPAQ